MLDTIISAASRHYLENETLEDDDALCVDIGSAFRAAVNDHVKDIENGLILLDELAQRVPEPGWVGSEYWQESWLRWLKSAFDAVEDNTPIAQLVIDDLEQNHSVNYAEHYAQRRRTVHERDMARSEAHAQ